MIEDIASIKIKGGIFEAETDLPIFVRENPRNPEQRFSLIYGKNGSGKSTISRGFRKLTGA